MSESAPKVLIVEDDDKLRTLLSEYLAGHGFEVTTEGRGDRALERIEAEDPDVVILDLMLPGMDGFTVCRLARARFSGGILMLTARQSSIDQAVGLEIGADDYVVKPVEPRVLLARLRSLLRRLAPVEPRAEPVSELTRGPLTVSMRRREATLAGEAIDLTSIELDVLWALAIRGGEVVSRDVLYQEVRGIPYDGIDRGMDIHISRIRRKLVAAGADGGWIKSVRGAGYILVELE